MKTAFVVMREKFGLVGGDVDRDRTVVLAALASQTEIERPLDMGITPARGDYIALGHLPQQMRAPAG